MGKLVFAFSQEAVFEAIGYEPFKEQWIIHRHTEKPKATVIVTRCGRRFGKTKWMGAGALRYFITPGSRIWIVAPEYSQGEKEWRHIWDATFKGPLYPKSGLQDGIKEIQAKQNNPTQGQMYLRILWKWGYLPSEVKVISWKKDPEKNVGEEVDLMLLSEGYTMPKDVWERYLLMNLTTRDGDVFLGSTAGENSEFMDEMFDRGQNQAEPLYVSYQFPGYCNPYWAPDIEAKKTELKRTLSPEAYREQVEGEKVNFSGRFYKEFNSEVHVKDINYLPNTLCYRSWDFGYRHPCIVWAQENKDDQLLLLFTYLGSDMSDSDLIWIAWYLSGELRADDNYKLYKEVDTYYEGRKISERRYLPQVIVGRIYRENLLPFFNFQDNIEFKDFCDGYGGTQQKTHEGTSIEIMNNYGIHPTYSFERFMPSDEEREPASVQIIRAELRPRPNNQPNLIVSSKNILGKNIFMNLSYEKPKNGVSSNRYDDTGDHSHAHDCLRYIEMHVRTHVLYNEKMRNIESIRYAG